MTVDFMEISDLMMLDRKTNITGMETTIMDLKKTVHTTLQMNFQKWETSLISGDVGIIIHRLLVICCERRLIPVSVAQAAGSGFTTRLVTSSANP